MRQINAKRVVQVSTNIGVSSYCTGLFSYSIKIGLFSYAIKIGLFSHVVTQINAKRFLHLLTAFFFLK